MNLARLNHILIPSTKTGRDRFRDSGFGRIVVRPVARLYLALTDEGRAVLGLALFAGFAGLDVRRSQNHVLWAALFGMLFASLAVRRLFPLAGMSVRCSGPGRVMAGERAEFRLTLENHGARTHHGLRVERPFLPWDGAWLGNTPPVPALAPGGRHSLALHARFAARGLHELDVFGVSALVPLRLATGPGIASEGTRFIVVPRIARITSLDLPLARRYQPGGVAQASRSDESLELLGVRPYRRGDRIRDLHAKTWARTGMPAVREYQQEYFARVGVFVDGDGSAASEEQLEGALSLAAGLIAQLAASQALIDLWLPGTAREPLTLGRSLGHFDQALDQLACVQPGPAFAPELLLEHLRPSFAQLSCMVLVCVAWDDARARVAARIREAGVGCRSLVVTAAKSSATALPGATAIRVAEIAAACSGPQGLQL